MSFLRTCPRGEIGRHKGLKRQYDYLITLWTTSVALDLA